MAAFTGVVIALETLNTPAIGQETCTLDGRVVYQLSEARGRPEPVLPSVGGDTNWYCGKPPLEVADTLSRSACKPVTGEGQRSGILRGLQTVFTAEEAVSAAGPTSYLGQYGGRCSRRSAACCDAECHHHLGYIARQMTVVCGPLAASNNLVRELVKQGQGSRHTRTKNIKEKVSHRPAELKKKTYRQNEQFTDMQHL